VAAALGQRGTEMEATAKFVKIVDRFFDCLNVGNYTDGKFSRNPFKQPYRGANDFRLKVCYSMHIFNRPIPPLLYIISCYFCVHILQWLETDFLEYLEEWQKTVEQRKGFTASEKKTMLLSDETATGLKLTGTHKTMDVTN